MTKKNMQGVEKNIRNPVMDLAVTAHVTEVTLEQQQQEKIAELKKQQQRQGILSTVEVQKPES